MCLHIIRKYAAGAHKSCLRISFHSFFWTLCVALVAVFVIATLSAFCILYKYISLCICLQNKLLLFLSHWRLHKY